MTPYRHAEIMCPHCGVALEPNAFCKKCEGAWVSESSLRKRLEAVKVDNTHLPNFDGFEKTGMQKYDCPVCHDPLDVVRIDDIEVERCFAAHGIWFDAKELQAVLHKASAGKEVPVDPGTPAVKPTLAMGLLDALAFLLDPRRTTL